MEDRWKKIAAERASDIIDAEDLDADSMELLNAEMRPESYIGELSAAKKWPDAVKVMARALPPREAVWWACVCARQMKELSSDTSQIASLEAAEKWVRKPTDENRREAFRLAQESASQSAGSLSALAVAFNEGKLPVADNQNFNLESSVFPQIVNAVVIIAASERQGEHFNEQLQCFLASGKDIACGGNGKIEEAG
jgi:hypothetical protein